MEVSELREIVANIQKTERLVRAARANLIGKLIKIPYELIVGDCFYEPVSVDIIDDQFYARQEPANWIVPLQKAEILCRINHINTERI